MKSGAGERIVFAAEVILFGLPSVAVSIPLVLIGLAVSVLAVWDAPLQAFPVFLVICGGAAGLVSWFVLSGTYLLGGKPELRQVDGWWWVGLGVGLVSASVFAVLSLSTSGLSDPSSRWMLLCGVPLILPAVHLISLKLRK